jgi:hypothetical protein
MATEPTIEAEVTFLSPDAGGFCEEPYLGVVFISGPAQSTAGQPSRVTLLLGYYPDVDYSALRDGATFTVREGGRVVGFGKVLQGHAATV